MFFFLGKLLKDLFDTANHQKPWSHFTKGQRKSLSQWKEQVAVSVCVKLRWCDHPHGQVA